MPMDFSKTLNLPSTSFDMRANLPAKEGAAFDSWIENKEYEKLMEINADKPLFVFHDGPPYANGELHLGHALNKTLKDFIVRYKNMSGFRTYYVHGWDTHGLPTEMVVMKKKKINRRDVGDVRYREMCMEVADEYVKIQKKQMQRLGVLGEWDDPYITFLPKFEEQQIKIFGEMLKRGHIYKGLKPVYWCAHDETALAEAEIEYYDVPCDSIYVKFPLCDDKGLIKPFTETLDNVYVLIWTTTTWTLPGNMAVCVGSDFEYALVKANGEYYIIAAELVKQVMEKAGITDYECVTKIKGSQFEYMKARHPFFDRESKMICGDHVTLESGTGCVHTAPGHGVDDFNVCKKYGDIDVVVPVDNKGFMTSEAGKYEGLKTDAANSAILADLKESGMLFATEKIEHQYPHCWRCRNPILFRATEQWFCSIDNFRKAALDAVKSVSWYPAWGELKIENMIKDRDDWCVSRQRIWGVPIPIFYCEKCGEYEINEEYIDTISALFGREGSTSWYKYTPEEIIGHEMTCKKCGNKTWRKENDIMDVWFDSGVSYAYTLDDRMYQSFPADLYLEGPDQYRGWFQSSLLTSVATRGCAPYKKVISHGLVVDGQGKAMSKSLGNGIDPQDVIKEYGADVLRLWVSSVDYTSDVKISKDILKQLSEIYRKIRNTARIMLGNLGGADDFNPDTDMVAFADMYAIDKWAVGKYNELIKKVNEAYENYQFHLIYHAIHNFCTVDMSKLYIDITKDRVYVERKDSAARRSAQSAMYIILNGLTRMIAPILPFTSDEIWKSMNHSSGDNKEHVIYNQMPKYNEEYKDAEIMTDWDALFEIREEVMKALEMARAIKVIGKSLDAKVDIYFKKECDAFLLLKKMSGSLNAVFMTSGCDVCIDEVTKDGDVTIPTVYDSDVYEGMTVAAYPFDGEKCGRCWLFTRDCEEYEGSVICKRCAEVLKG